MCEVPCAGNPDLKTELLALTALLGGCDRVFLTERPPVDGACGVSDDDEDGDCFANAVDNCPGVANTDQAAVLDGDPVGDACDPNPTTGGDRIFAYEPFVVTTARWRDASPDTPWMIAEGVARHTSTTDIAALFQHTGMVATAEVTVDATFEFIAWAAGITTTTPATTQLGIRIDGTQDQPNGHSCRLDPVSANIVDLVLEDASLQLTTQSVPAPIKDQRIELRLSRKGTERIRCELRAGDAAPVVIELARQPADVWPTARYVGVDAPGVVVSLLQATIYVVD